MDELNLHDHLSEIQFISATSLLKLLRTKHPFIGHYTDSLLVLCAYNYFADQEHCTKTQQLFLNMVDKDLEDSFELDPEKVLNRFRQDKPGLFRRLTLDSATQMMDIVRAHDELLHQAILTNPEHVPDDLFERLDRWVRRSANRTPEADRRPITSQTVNVAGNNTGQPRWRKHRITAAALGTVAMMAGTLAYHHLDGRNQHTVIASSPETLDGQARYRVIDGDTIEADYGAKYRLLGFDAPETRHSKCAEERVLGQQAAKRLKTLLASGEIHVIKSGGFDKRDRPLVRVIVDGRDVGEILISEGLALPYSPGICKKWC